MDILGNGGGVNTLTLFLTIIFGTFLFRKTFEENFEAVPSTSIDLYFLSGDEKSDTDDNDDDVEDDFEKELQKTILKADQNRIKFKKLAQICDR